MSEDTAAQALPQRRLREISRRLQHLLALRAAFTPFQATIWAQGERLHEPGGRRQLLVLWRPCQERLDLLLDTAAHRPAWAAHLHLLRQEVEDSLLDELCSPIALADLASAFDQACEALLLQVGQDLQEAIAQLDELSGATRLLPETE